MVLSSFGMESPKSVLSAILRDVWFGLHRPEGRLLPDSGSSRVLEVSMVCFSQGLCASFELFASVFSTAPPVFNRVFAQEGW